MATIKLNKSRPAPAPGERRAPVRSGGLKRTHPTLAQAQAERAQKRPAPGERPAPARDERRPRVDDTKPARRASAPAGDAPRAQPRREPRADDRRGARADDRGVRTDERRAPRTEERRGRADERPAPRSDRRDAPRMDTRRDPRFDERRGPPAGERPAPAPRGDTRSAPRANERHAAAVDPRRGPRFDERRGPRVDDRRGPRVDDRPGPRVDDRNRPPADPRRAAAAPDPRRGGRPDERPFARANDRRPPPEPLQRRPATEPRAAAAAGADELPRLSKRMSELGLASRREADEWIERGLVRVDGEVVDQLGTRVRPEQRIDVDPLARNEQAQRVTILLHKPLDIVSGQAEDGHVPAAALVNAESRWAGDRHALRFHASQLRHLVPAGRLDVDSTGLLVLTQDGRIAKALIGADTKVEKEYVVQVAWSEQPDAAELNKIFPADKLELMRSGLELDGQKLKPAKVSWANERHLRFVLREGKRRQIRRMCEAVGLQVLALKRIRIGRVGLGDIPPGQWRYLSPFESF